MSYKVTKCGGLKYNTDNLIEINGVITSADNSELVGEPFLPKCGGQAFDGGVFKSIKINGKDAITTLDVDSSDACFPANCSLVFDGNVFGTGDDGELTMAELIQYLKYTMSYDETREPYAMKYWSKIVDRNAPVIQQIKNPKTYLSVTTLFNGEPVTNKYYYSGYITAQEDVESILTPDTPDGLYVFENGEEQTTSKYNYWLFAPITVNGQKFWTQVGAVVKGNTGSFPDDNGVTLFSFYDYEGEGPVPEDALTMAYVSEFAVVEDYEPEPEPPEIIL